MSSDARAVVLGRIQDALALADAPAVSIPRDYRVGRTLPDGERLDLFVDRLVDYQAHVHTCTGAETAATIARVLREHDVKRLGVPSDLDRALLETFEGEIEEDSTDIPAPRLDSFDGVVTLAAVACAETGTIFLDASTGQGRRALTLVPDLHVCVVDLSQVTVGVPEAVAQLVPERPTTLISGPSATSDIELERVEGVHGPRTLIVIIRTDA